MVTLERQLTLPLVVWQLVGKVVLLLSPSLGRREMYWTEKFTIPATFIRNYTAVMHAVNTRYLEGKRLRGKCFTTKVCFDHTAMGMWFQIPYWITIYLASSKEGENSSPSSFLPRFVLSH